MQQIEAGAIEGMERYSNTTAVVIEGKRIQVGLAFEKAGRGSEPHSHPNEQFNFVLKGTFRVKVGDGEEMLAPQGSRSRLAGADLKPPSAAANKRRGSERLWKRHC